MNEFRQTLDKHFERPLPYISGGIIFILGAIFYFVFLHAIERPASRTITLIPPWQPQGVVLELPPNLEKLQRQTSPTLADLRQRYESPDSIGVLYLTAQVVSSTREPHIRFYYDLLEGAKLYTVRRDVAHPALALGPYEKFAGCDELSRTLVLLCATSADDSAVMTARLTRVFYTALVAFVLWILSWPFTIRAANVPGPTSAKA